jgi:rsbT antagonist protein RsbS
LPHAAGKYRRGILVDRIPILKIGEFLIVTIQVDMHDRMALDFQDDLSTMIVKTGARGVMIDISALDMVDSFIGRVFGTIAQMARLLDAEIVVVGMRPAVAITLVELGLSLKGVYTALHAEAGMELLHKRMEQRKQISFIE